MFCCLSCRYIGSYPFDHHCQEKPDTTSTNVIFSSNGKRLATSLLLVITTIILLSLLIFNLNCIILTEATVNTTSTTTTTITTTTTTTNSSHLLHKTSHQITTTPPPPLPLVTSLSHETSTTPKPPPSPHLDIHHSSDHHPPNGPDNEQHETSSVTNSILTSPAITVTTPSRLLESNTEQINNKLKQQDLSANDINNNNFLLSSTVKPTNLDPTQIMSENSTTSTSLSSSNQTVASQSNDDNVSREDPCKEILPDKGNISMTTALETFHNDSSHYFNIDYACRTFEDSMVDPNAIILHSYLNGFKELMKFFHSLGTIFLFVTSDLESKIGLLENYRNIEKGSCNPAYLTIQSAIEYETKENLLRDLKRQSGARTILRLHRALEFLSAMMLNLSKLDMDSETFQAVREAYSNSMAKHHPWTIRYIASLAMRTLPAKKNLVISVLGKENSMNETETNLKMLNLSTITENLFNIVDKYYEENNIKDLP